MPSFGDISKTLGSIKDSIVNKIEETKPKLEKLISDDKSHPDQDRKKDITETQSKLGEAALECGSAAIGFGGTPACLIKGTVASAKVVDSVKKHFGPMAEEIKKALI